jgi:hypothetical protein
MKRILFMIGFGFLGLVFVFLVQNAVVNVIDHGLHQYESGSDERGEHELKTLFLGGPLFIAIWAWIGNASYKNWPRGMAMASAVFLAALICFGIPGLHGPLASIFNFSGNSLGLAAWALVSATLAFVSGQIFRTPTNKTRSAAD